MSCELEEKEKYIKELESQLELFEKNLSGVHAENDDLKKQNKHLQGFKDKYIRDPSNKWYNRLFIHLPNILGATMVGLPLCMLLLL